MHLKLSPPDEQGDTLGLKQTLAFTQLTWPLHGCCGADGTTERRAASLGRLVPWHHQQAWSCWLNFVGRGGQFPRGGVACHAWTVHGRKGRDEGVCYYLFLSPLSVYVCISVSFLHTPTLSFCLFCFLSQEVAIGYYNNYQNKQMFLTLMMGNPLPCETITTCIMFH